MFPGIPVLGLRAAYGVLALNLVLPGAGTAVLARSGPRFLWWKALAQLASAILLVGWLWALVTSTKAVANARLAASGALTRHVPVREREAPRRLA